MSVDSLVEKVEQWGVDRNITAQGGATVQAQFSKGLEEMAEGFSTLDLLNLNEWKYNQALPGTDVEKQQLEDKLKDDIGDVVVCMIQAARLAGFTLEECLEKSWEDIKDRRGTMVNGKFVKEE